MHKSILDFTDFCYLPPSQFKVLNFEAKVKIRKVIEFFLLSVVDATSPLSCVESGVGHSGFTNNHNLYQILIQSVFGVNAIRI